MTTATITRQALREQAAKSKTSAVEASTDLSARDSMALDLYLAGGVTYGDLAADLGVTRDRVSQILAEQRKIRAASA